MKKLDRAAASLIPKDLAQAKLLPFVAIRRKPEDGEVGGGESSFLLMEIGDKILLESGDGILLE